MTGACQPADLVHASHSFKLGPTAGSAALAVPVAIGRPAALPARAPRPAGPGGALGHWCHRPACAVPARVPARAALNGQAKELGRASPAVTIRRPAGIRRKLLTLRLSDPSTL